MVPKEKIQTNSLITKCTRISEGGGVGEGMSSLDAVWMFCGMNQHLYVC
jgi:hypothetical protein